MNDTQRDKLLLSLAEGQARIDKRLDAMDGRLDGIDGRLGSMDRRLDSIDHRLDGLTHGQARILESLRELARARIDADQRLTQLERGGAVK